MRILALVRCLSWRVLFLLLGASTFIGSYYYGATLHLSYYDAKIITAQINVMNKGLDQKGVLYDNVKSALGMFVPVFGAGLGVYSGYSTGLVFSSFAQLYPDLKTESPFTPLSWRFAIMEVFVYGLAISRGGLLTYDLVKKKSLGVYAIHMAVEISIGVAVLIIASIIQWQTIQNQLHLAGRSLG